MPSPSRIGTDTSSEGSVSGSTFTVSHTVPATGQNRALIVIPVNNDNTKNTTGVTWNGTAMTQLYYREATQRQDISFWFLANPEAGTFNIVSTQSGSGATAYGLSAFTLQDCVQSSPADGTNGAGANATSISASITSTVDNDLYIVAIVQNAGTSYVDDGTQSRISTLINLPGTDDHLIVSDDPQTTAGAKSMGYTWTTSGGTDLAMIALKYVAPTTATTTNQSKLLLMGVG